jgi:hypothetical protein
VITKIGGVAATAGVYRRAGGDPENQCPGSLVWTDEDPVRLAQMTAARIRPGMEGAMRRLTLMIVVATALVIGLAAPVGAAAAKPASAIVKPAGCDSIRFEWSGFRKAATAEFRLHHDGIFQASTQLAPVGPAGTYAIPVELTGQIVAGEHYTVLGHLLDSSGRSITPSGAVWWGVC